MPETVFRPRAAHQPPPIRTEAYVWHCLSRQFGFLFASGRIPDFDIWIVPPTGGHPLAVRTDGNEFHPRLGASQCLQRPASHIENVATIFVSKSGHAPIQRRTTPFRQMVRVKLCREFPGTLIFKRERNFGDEAFQTAFLQSVGLAD